MVKNKAPKSFHSKEKCETNLSSEEAKSSSTTKAL